MASRNTPNRSFLEIQMDVLSVLKLNGETKPTHILYKANLSQLGLNKVLSQLMEKNLVSVQEYGTRRKYTLTEKGRRVSNMYDGLMIELNIIKESNINDKPKFLW